MSFDAVIIPGGGLRADGSLPPWIAACFDVALERQPDGPFIALSGGSPHKPAPLDPTGRAIYEAVAGGAYLLNRGVPSDRIYTEISSYDTIGNAFFTRTQHTDMREWHRLLVVSCGYHAARMEAIFRWMFALAPEHPYELSFVAADDTTMPVDIRAGRLAREAVSLAQFRQTADRLHSLAEVHAWMYADHAAYRVESVIAPRPVDPRVARLY